MLTRRKTGSVLHTIRLVKRYQFNYYLFTINIICTQQRWWMVHIFSVHPKQSWWSIKRLRSVSPEQHQAGHSRRVPEQSWGLLIIRLIVWGRHGDSAQMLKIAPKCSAAAAWLLLPGRKCFSQWVEQLVAVAGGDHRWATGRSVYFVPRTIVRINRCCLTQTRPRHRHRAGWSVLLCNNNYNYKVWTVWTGNQLQRWRPDRGGVRAGIMLTLQQIVLTAGVCW